MPRRTSIENEIKEHMERARRIFGGPPRGDFVTPFLEPPIDVYVAGDKVVALVEIAGVRPEDIEIEADERTLTVRGERCTLPGEAQRHYAQMEIATGAFQRTIDLPETVNPEQANAVYRDGVLEVVLSRARRVVGTQLRIVVH